MADNKHPVNFNHFKQLFQQQPYAVANMMNTNGSFHLKKSKCFKGCLQLVQKRYLVTAPSIVITPTILIFLGTIILHRKRSLALTSGTVLRRFTLKYLPLITCYAVYQYLNLPLFNISHLEKDYTQIQDELSILFKKYPQQQLSQFQWWNLTK